MSLDKFMEDVSILDDGALSSEDMASLDKEAAHLLDLMEHDEIDIHTDEGYNMQNALDLYIINCKSREYLDVNKEKNVMRYNSILERRNQKVLEQEKANPPRTLQIKPINSDGIISTITIIELVLLGGILISFLLLALM